MTDTTTAYLEPELRYDSIRGPVEDIALFLNCPRCGDRIDTNRRFTDRAKALAVGATTAEGHETRHRLEDRRRAAIAADPFHGLA